MPSGDGTGPRGMGPRTGRGLGNCPPAKSTKKTAKTKTTRPRARGRGLGRGLGLRGRTGQ